ncbi:MULTISPECIES: LLM class oxidoreductase [Flavobacterium]|uniref:LLM class oxidoreductase n=1 Tax=Flavobacterium TaxID=237 RepID=UPI0021155B16|nr:MULTISPECIES: LLM class oxidoreductase [Flavobacterium]UUF12440.1 LLM class oxidoreductase [Flavobacterium panici]
MLSLSKQPFTEQPGFKRTYQPNKLTLGLFYPIEAYQGEAPTMENHIEIAQQAEDAGFAALWLRDVPLRDPNFGDLGQIFDPFVYLGFLAAKTKNIALATGAIVLPIRNPLHLAKAATSIDQLSGGRLLLGLASGDRPVEFPAFGVDMDERGEIFREYFEVFRKFQKTSFETIEWSGGLLSRADMVPKPVTQEVPLLITGHSQQSLDWIAKNGHGWVSYPRSPEQQKNIIQEYRAAVQRNCGTLFKPFSQSLYIDLSVQPDDPLQPIHLGYKLGRNVLLELLELLESIGVNHVILSLKYSQRPAGEVIEELRKYVVPRFPSIMK